VQRPQLRQVTAPSPPVIGTAPASTACQTAASIPAKEDSTRLGVTTASPRSTTFSSARGLRLVAGSQARSRADCSRMAAGPWRDPMRTGWVPQSKGMPMTTARLPAALAAAGASMKVGAGRKRRVMAGRPPGAGRWTPS
jgi:hypothetical protein